MPSAALITQFGSLLLETHNGNLHIKFRYIIFISITNDFQSVPLHIHNGIDFKQQVNVRERTATIIPQHQLN